MPRSVANAFGRGSPSWNLEFPEGNLTAAEIIAYCPHWLKSIDVIDRFIRNGATSTVLAAVVNEFRDLPVKMHRNSLCIMMQNAMRAADYEGWTAGSHQQHVRDTLSEWDESDISVTGFRCPWETHPKQGNAAGCNLRAKPMNFRDLARHVAQHPSGPDALDLTRCVAYALSHPNQNYFFPTDFERLVNRLGGPRDPVLANADTHVFQPRTRKATADIGRSSPQIENAGTRKSTRLAKKLSQTLRDTSSATTNVDSPTKDNEDAESKIGGKRKRRGEEEYEPTAFDNASVSSDDDIDVAEEEFALPPTPRGRGRPAAKKARLAIRDLTTAENTPIIRKTNSHHQLAQPSVTIDPSLTELASQYNQHVPARLNPPTLSPHRLKVDHNSVLLYSEIGALNPWASALSSTRFNGPRTSAPFRELHRLTDPALHDTSDWAENIRWAKQQFRMYGSETWTEYDYHLEVITDHRRGTHWVSEEAITFGIF
ncbi:hypothetical protein K504DRAFT_432991 [Pleomassaria siparia CBS 279.74]|uniref:Uncharacterized protein n=1 Tax=Pleomassaria siparia CBS 279.74 TaxID=1314801 RepID=A0A6G1K851_9PLEO|nr:hypothetical protein K504DRAFT_432991 [Pleomassaria siparia CBS 279.74]